MSVNWNRRVPAAKAVQKGTLLMDKQLLQGKKERRIYPLLRIISCAFFLKELFVRANRKCIFTGNYVTRGKIDSFK